MAIEFEDGIKPEEELKTLESYTKEEELKEKQELEKSTPKTELGDEFKFYVNFLHKTIYNNIFKIGLPNEIITELDDNLIKIIEKRFPNIASILDKFGPELAYLGTLATGYLIATQMKAEMQQIEENSKDEQENNN